MRSYQINPLSFEDRHWTIKKLMYLGSTHILRKYECFKGTCCVKYKKPASYIDRCIGSDGERLWLSPLTRLPCPL